MSQKHARGVRKASAPSVLFRQAKLLQKSAVAWVATQWLESRLNPEIDDRRLAIGARFFQQTERGVAMAKADMRQREVIARHVAAPGR